MQRRESLTRNRRSRRAGMRGPRPATTLGLLLTSITLLLCGCKSEPHTNPMAGAFYLNEHRDPRSLARVALVELENRSDHPELSAAVTQALFMALQKRQVFGLTLVPQSEVAWDGLEEGANAPESLQRLAAVRKSLNCTGLLVGAVTQYQPYPHMTIGLRLKLVDLNDGELIWGCEQVWDCGDGSLEDRIGAYFKEERRAGLAPLREELVTMSTINFAKFVAYEVAETFEPVGK